MGVTAGLCMILLGILACMLLKRYRKRKVPQHEKEESDTNVAYNQEAPEIVIWTDVQSRRGELDACRPIQELESNNPSKG